MPEYPLPLPINSLQTPHYSVLMRSSKGGVFRLSFHRSFICFAVYLLAVLREGLLWPRLVLSSDSLYIARMVLPTGQVSGIHKPPYSADDSALSKVHKEFNTRKALRKIKK